jgi:hypothetical protein
MEFAVPYLMQAMLTGAEVVAWNTAMARSSKRFELASAVDGSAYLFRGGGWHDVRRPSRLSPLSFKITVFSAVTSRLGDNWGKWR